MLDQQVAWYVSGPVLGLCVVACRALFNGRLGVTGGFSELLVQLGRRSARFDWRGWFAIGILVGGALFALARGEQGFSGYGWLTDTFDGAGALVIGPVLLGAGVLIGFGAKTRGRLHVGQRADRQLDALAGEPGLDRDVHRDRDRRRASLIEAVI